MGKNRAIKSIGGLIAGMVAHSILAKHTNRPESLNHLESEIDNYRDNLLNVIKKFNWNDGDKQRIREESLKNIKKEFNEPHFKDVKFPIEEVDKLIDGILKEIFL